MTSPFSPLVFVGAGVFGEMLIKKVLSQGFLQPNELIATVRRVERAKYLAKLYGIRVETDNREAIKDSRTVVLCVRPQDVNALASSLDSSVFQDKLLVSVVAGISLSKLANLFHTNMVIRTSPNPQAEVGYGYTVIATSSGVDPEARTWANSLFGCVGDTSFLDEGKFDAVAALSGITHVLYFFDCLVDAGIYLGLPKLVAEEIAYKSILGTMVLWSERKNSPSELIREGATPGGVSVEKIFVLEKRRLRATIIEAMRAARDKASSFNTDSWR